MIVLFAITIIITKPIQNKCSLATASFLSPCSCEASLSRLLQRVERHPAHHNVMHRTAQQSRAKNHHDYRQRICIITVSRALACPAVRILER